MRQASRPHLFPGDAQQGMHAFLLSLGIEQAWTAPASSHRSPLQVVRYGVEFGL
jgi:hypothetical protein